MKTSKRGIDFIKGYEQLRLKAYQCEGKVWTLGYGSTTGIKQGMTCTEAEAEEMLARDLAEAERAVNRHVKRNLTQNQYDALVAFTFNVGAGEDGFKGSTLLEKLNAMDDAGVKKEFGRWVYAKGKKSDGLIRRRKAEADMFAELPWSE